MLKDSGLPRPEHDLCTALQLHAAGRLSVRAWVRIHNQLTVSAERCQRDCLDLLSDALFIVPESRRS